MTDEQLARGVGREAVGVNIETSEDIIVDRPIPRETIRGVASGYLVTCTDVMHCEWQGLFPDPALAATAAERHYDHERHNGQYHHGMETYIVVELVDRATAYSVDQSSLGLSVEEIRMGDFDGDVREFEFPRTTDDVGELVQRGDRIETVHDTAKVAGVTETRSSGLPTWTVYYVDEDVDLTDADRHDYRWANELVAQGEEIYRSFGPDPTAAPALEVVGTADHQADIGVFAEEGSA